jgi:hypothetical protein
MLLELVQDTELWVVLPDGTNVRIDCRGKGPAVVEHWHQGQVEQVIELKAIRARRESSQA